MLISSKMAAKRTKKSYFFINKFTELHETFYTICNQSIVLWTLFSFIEHYRKNINILIILAHFSLKICTFLNNCPHQSCILWNIAILRLHREIKLRVRSFLSKFWLLSFNIYREIFWKWWMRQKMVNEKFTSK